MSFFLQMPLKYQIKGTLIFRIQPKEVTQKVTWAGAGYLPHSWCCVFCGLAMPQEGRS